MSNENTNPINYISINVECKYVATDLGNVIGTVMANPDGSPTHSSELNFLRVKVQIDPRLPLVQNIRIRLDNNVVCNVECKYERVFRSCSSCHRIGHLVPTCPHTVVQNNEGYSAIAQRTFDRFGTRFICSFNARAAELTWQDWIRGHRSRGSTRIRFNRYHGRYRVFETLPQDVLLLTDRFEGIFHLSDDEFTDDDMLDALGGPVHEDPVVDHASGFDPPIIEIDIQVIPIPAPVPSDSPPSQDSAQVTSSQTRASDDSPLSHEPLDSAGILFPQS